MWTQGGCSDDEPTVTADAAEVVADWIHPACSAQGLAPPAPDSCAGPWAYGYQDLTQSRELCGEGECTRHHTCNSWHLNTVGDWLGVSRRTLNELGRTAGYTCNLQGRNCYGVLPSQIATYCNNAAAARRTQLLSTTLAGVPSSVTNTMTATGGYYISDQGTDGDVRWTTWQCTVTIANYPEPKTEAKPVCGCAERAALVCPRSSGTITTAPGLPRPASPGPAAVAGDTRVFTSAPVCQTCDELPFGTAAEAQAKAACLEQKLATATGELRTSLRARLQLLLQLAGDRLTPAQAERARQTYVDEPTAGVACREPLTLPAACDGVPGRADVAARLQLCQDLLSNPSTPLGVAAAELSRCLSTAAPIAATGQACRVALRDTADNVAQGVFGKSQPAFSGDLTAALSATRTRLDEWWQSSAQLAGNDVGWHSARMGQLLRWLWATIETQRTPLPTQHAATDAEAAAILADLGDTRLAQDIAVLSSLFAPGQIGTPPILTLAGDALQALADRAQRLLPMHDVACRFLQCAQGSLRSSETSELVRVLAALPDVSELTAALAAASRLQARQPALFAALTRVRDQHAYFGAAWAALGRSEPFSAMAALSDIPREVETLAAIVRGAKVAWGSYQRSGMFSPQLAPRVSASTLRKAELMASFDAAIAGVTGDRDVYTGARRATLNDMLDLISQGQTVLAAKARWDDANVRQIELAERQDALLLREVQEAAQSAAFQRGFEALMESGAVDEASVFATQTVFAAQPVRATDAHFVAGTPMDLARDRFAVTSLAPGEVLRARVTGSYAPDCALRKAQLLGPGGRPRSSVQISSAAAGPDGYWVTWQGSSYIARSNAFTNGTSVSLTVSAEACAGAAAYGNSTRVCATYAMSKSLSLSNTLTNGNEWRRSAAFNVGLRLEDTPFPDAPAGSLLAVFTKAGAPEDVREVHVVTRDAVLAAPALAAGETGGYEVHFVVNDAAPAAGDPACRADNSALTLEVVRTVPVGNVAQALGVAMGKALRSIETRADTVIRQGELSATESTVLRNDAWTVLRASLPTGIGIGAMPVELRQYFEAGLERELASLSRRAQLRALGVQQLRTAMEMDAIGGERDAAAAQSRLRHLIPRWRLRDLAGTELVDTVEHLAETMTVHVAPALELHDPTSLATLRADQATAFSAVIDASLTAPFETPLADLLQLANATRATLSTAVLEPPSTMRSTIVVAIPRPTEAGQEPWTGPYRTVSEPTARAFWSSAFSAPGVLSGNARVSLTPADVYSVGGGMAQLSCQKHAPVVRHLGLYFATDGWMERLVAQDVAGAAAAAATVSFPAAGRVYELLPADPAGIALAPRALNGDTVDVLSGNGFGQWPIDLDPGAGISPFTSFHLDLRGFQTGVPRNVLDHTRALMMVMEVEQRISTAPAWVPGVCQLVAPASP